MEKLNIDFTKVDDLHLLCKQIDLMNTEDREKALKKLFFSIGEGSVIRRGIMVDTQNASIGNNCFINHNLTVLGFSPVVIGNNVGISSGVTLIAIKHPQNPLYGEWVDLPGPIKICDGALIGANVTIFPGVVIGENAKVGAGAVVVKDVPPGATVFGNPARVIKTSKTIGEHGKSQLDDRYLAQTTQRD